MQGIPIHGKGWNWIIFKVPNHEKKKGDGVALSSSARKEEQLQPFLGEAAAHRLTTMAGCVTHHQENLLAAFLTDIVHLKKLHFPP